MTSWLATKLHRHPRQEERFELPFCDGKSPEVRKAEARRAQYEHRQRILAQPEFEKLFAARDGS